MPDEPIAITTRFERVLMGVEKELRPRWNGRGTKPITLASREARSSLRRARFSVTAFDRTLTIGEGIVYDSFGDETGQTDIIIANGEQPFTFPSGESGEYAIEGVSAVGEVKSNLTDPELKDCIKKATAYKRLRQIIRSEDRILNLSPYTLETSVMPLFFVIAHESSMTMRNILTKLDAAPAVSVPDGKGFTNDSPQPPIDAVCVLGRGPR